MDAGFVQALLSRLRLQREYPKFQYERRIDPFISFFLQHVLGYDSGECIPEFPLKAHSTRRLCTNVDYLLLDEHHTRALFVELKTDRGSVSDRQLEQYNQALQASSGELVEDIRWIREGTNHRRKYDHLLRQLGDIPPEAMRRALYLAPADVEKNFRSALSIAVARRPDHQAVQPQWDFMSLQRFARLPYNGLYADVWDVLGSHIRQTFGPDK